MVNAQKQADICLALFKGEPVSKIKRVINNLYPQVIDELCSRFNCSKDQLASKIANS